MRYLGFDRVGGNAGFVPAAKLMPAGQIVEATASIWRGTVSGVVTTTAAAMILTFSAIEGTNPSLVSSLSTVSSVKAPPSLNRATLDRAKTFNALTKAVQDDNSPDPDYGF